MTLDTPRQRGSILLVAAAALLTLGGPTACSKNDGEESSYSAEVSLDDISPAPNYPGVEATLQFTITPGADTTAEDLTWAVDFGDGESTQGEDIAAGEARHTYAFSGDFTVTVQALAGGEIVGEDSATYSVLSPVDLGVSDVRGQPANIDAGDTLTASLTLTNNLAEDVITPVTLGAYLSEGPDVDAEAVVDLTPLGSDLLEPEGDAPVVAAGTDRSVAFDVTLPAELDSGDYYLVIVADPDEAIADEDRANNLAVSQAVVRVTNANQLEPDLAVLDVIAGPDRAFPELNSFSRGLRVVNNGGLDLFQVVVETYLSRGDAELSDGDVLVDTSAPIDQITARGSEATIEPSPIVLDEAIVPPPGEEVDVYVIVKAYSLDDVTESDDANNVAAAANPIVVSDQLVDGPDVVVREFSVAPERTYLDGALEYNLTLANEGTADVSSFLCRVYLGDDARINTLQDQPVDSINITSLASEEERVIEDTITISALFDPGTYYIYVICDPNDLLGEPFRSNNQAIHPNPITITDQADVDVTVDALTVPTDANEGDTVTITATICASGTNATGQTQATLHRTPGRRVDFNTAPLATADVDNINPGECADVDFELEATCEQFEEEYAFGVVADALDRLPETDEDNNARAGDNQLTVQGTYCACTEDAYEPNNRPFDAQSLMSGPTDLALCTAGTCDFFLTPPLTEGDSVVITNTHDPSRGVLTTKLYDPSGLQGLDIDRSEQGSQEVAAFLTAGGEYVVEVCGSQTGTRNLYELDIELLAQSAGLDVIPRDLTLPTRDSFSIGASLDVGFNVYNLGQRATGNFEAELRISADRTIDANDPLLGAVTVEAMAPTSQREITTSVTLPVALNDGDYYIGVTLDPLATLGETDATNNVTLSEELTVKTECYDPLEPNDTFIDAAPITGSGTFSNLSACTSAADYYEICVADGKKLTVTTSFTHASGDIDMLLYDEQLQQIDSSSTQGDSEQVAVAYVNGAQCYYAQVYMRSIPGQMMPENLYQLAVDIQDVNPSLLCSSWGEPNDTFDTAQSLLAASNAQQLDRCPAADTDFFYFDVSSPGQLVTITATKDPAAQAGTLRLQLFNPNRTPTLNEETAPDQPTASIEDYAAAQAGRYWVQVTVSGSTRNVTYTLDVDGLGGVDLEPQNLQIGPGTYKPGDSVRVGFDIANLGADATMAAPSFELYLGASATPDPANDTPLGAGGYIAPSIVSGNSSIYIFEQPNLPLGLTQGTYYLHVLVADASDVNTSNNSATIPVQVVP